MESRNQILLGPSLAQLLYQKALGSRLVLCGVVAVIIQYLVLMSFFSVYLDFSRSVVRSFNRMSKNGICPSFSFYMMNVIPSVVWLVVCSNLSV